MGSGATMPVARLSMNDPHAIFLTEFLVSAEELVARLAAEMERLRFDPANAGDLKPLLRGFHSLKGNSSFLPDCPITPLAHAAEDAVEAVRDGFVDPARLVQPLTATLDCIELRLEEYRLRGAPAPPSAREQELAAAMRALAAAEGEQAGLTSRYFFAGEDVTEALALITEAERGGIDKVRLANVRDRLRRLAAAGGASGAAELDTHAEPDSRALLHWLAERAVRVPVAKNAKSLANTPRAEGSEPPRGGVVPRHFAVEASIVDEFLEHAVELRLFGERIAHLDRRLHEIVDVPARRPDAGDNRRLLEHLATELRAAHNAFMPLASRLQERLLAIRRVPVKRLLDRHAAMIRDLGPRLGKEVEVVLDGATTRVDKSIIEQLEAPLTHMVRNALDHGLESWEARRAQEKPSAGTIMLRASTEGQWFVLEVADDGAGIDAAALRRSAVERGFLDASAAARMSDEQVMHLVFLPGLSCRREVNEFSGRGIGMDEVFATVRQLRGTIRIRSEAGRGTSFIIKVPDTGFAIVRCVPVRVGKVSFFIPHDTTRRWSDCGIDPERDGPLIELADIAPHLGAARDGFVSTPSDETGRAGPGVASVGRSLIVVLEGGGRRFGLHIDEVGREVDVVARPLDRELVRAPLWSMAALGEEGETRLVLDVDGVAAHLPAVGLRSAGSVIPDVG